LGFCTQYSDLACCTEEVDAGVGGNLTAVAAKIFGHGACFHRLADMSCALACSPHQADYMSNITANADGSFNVSIFVSPDFAQALWGDCSHHKMLATTTVETYFDGPQALLAQIASGIQNEQVQSVTIEVGFHPFSHMAVGEDARNRSYADPPPLSELTIGLDALPEEPLQPPGMVPMYLLLFAAGLGVAFALVLACCGPRAVTAPSITAPRRLKDGMSSREWQPR